MAYPSTKHFTLFTLLNLFPSAQSAQLRMFFTYQSRLNEPIEWFIMFTLCLAPLVTHITFGLAKLVTLSEKNPPWTEKITQFSPISILWRYYAIAYRRLRATQWDAADMAACNAAFWDGKRWEGSEYMMIRSREYLTNRPDLSHVALISGSTLATIALILQGTQSIFIIAGAAVTGTPNSNIGFGNGLPCLLIHIIYVLRRDHVSTVIPCNQSKWYKWHTYLMIATAAAAVIAGSLETLRWPDGKYTTYPPSHCTRDGICTPLNKTAYLENIGSNWEGFLDELGVK